jgi:hypothetical protein
MNSFVEPLTVKLLRSDYFMHNFQAERAKDREIILRSILEFSLRGSSYNSVNISVVYLYHNSSLYYISFALYTINEVFPFVRLLHCKMNLNFVTSEPTILSFSIFAYHFR